MVRSPVSFRVGDAPSTIIQAALRSTMWNWATGLVKLRLQGAAYSDELAVHPDEREDVRHRIEIPVIAGHHLPVKKTHGEEAKHAGHRSGPHSAVTIAARSRV